MYVWEEYTFISLTDMKKNLWKNTQETVIAVIHFCACGGEAKLSEQGAEDKFYCIYFHAFDL